MAFSPYSAHAALIAHLLGLTGRIDHQGMFPGGQPPPVSRVPLGPMGQHPMFSPAARAPESANIYGPPFDYRRTLVPHGAAVPAQPHFDWFSGTNFM